MKEVVDAGLPALAQPFSWAVKAGGMLFTTHGPVRADGSIDTGPIEQQARLTLENVRQAVIASGAQMCDVVQVMIYLVDVADMPIVDAVYREFFAVPYPNRSSVGVNALVVPGMRIEVVVYATVSA